MRHSFVYIILILYMTNIQFVKSQSYIYSGEIKYRTERLKIAMGSGTDAGYDWNVGVNERMILNATIFARFSGVSAKLPPGMPLMFHLTGIESEDITFENSVANEGNERRVSQQCLDERARITRIATPGDSESYSCGQRCSIVDPEKKKTEGGFIMIRDNEYTINLTGKFKYNVDFLEATERTLACSDTILPPTSLSANETLEFPFSIAGTGTLDKPDEISGYNTPVDIASTDCSQCIGSLASYVHGDVDCSYIVYTTMSWSLTRNCDVRGTVESEIDKNDGLKDFQKERIMKVLEKLENPDIDARVFISATNIKEVRELDQADIVLEDDSGYLVDLRELFNEYCEKYGNDKKFLTKQVINTDREIVRIINMFYEYYVRENMLAEGQVKIKDWIADQQRNPGSIYNCYADE